jgi:hypothetical protein
MKTVVDKYLDNLQEHILYEGIWTAVRKTLEFPTAKHPVYRAMIKNLNNRYIMCRSSYPANVDKQINVNSKWGELNFKDYKENPDYLICLDNTYLDFANEFLKWVKKSKPEEVCKYNKNKNRCIKWLQNEVNEAKINIKNLKRQMQQMKTKRMNRSAFIKFQKDLYIRGPKK